MKKLLSLILALVLVFGVAACSLFGNPEQEATETAESFMDCLVNLEFDELGRYVVDEDALPPEITELDIDAEFKKALGDLPAEMTAYEADFEKIFDAIVNKIKEGLSYEIKSIDRNDFEGYTITVALTSPDFDTVDFDTVFSDIADEGALSDIILQMTNEGKITASSTEQEIIDLVMPEVIKLMEDAILDIEFDVTTEEEDLVIVKTDDGEWLIDVEKSDF